MALAAEGLRMRVKAGDGSRSDSGDTAVGSRNCASVGLDGTGALAVLERDPVADT